jgi:GR25 family glycosyltransferase involved in LPS biosynthesis
MTTTNSLFGHTLFINLESRVDRLIQVKTELLQWGIQTPERFNAVKTTNGAIGCAMSHIKCLELAKERDYPHVFICEDDIHCVDIPRMRAQVEEFYKANTGDTWDVLILGGNNAPPYRMLNEGLIQVYNCQTTTGYIVRRHYYDTLIANFREGIKHLMRNPANSREYTIDNYWKHLQQKDRWFMLLPLTVTQRASYSNVENRDVDCSELLLDYEKRYLQPKMRAMTYVNRA